MQVSFLNTDIPFIDVRSALDGVIRRWWVVLLSIIVSTGIVFAQDSGLRTEPNGSVIVERAYEAITQVDELVIVKVDPAAIAPVPSFDNQLAILRSEDTLKTLQFESGSPDVVEVTRSEPKFTIVETIDETNNRVSFLSTGTPTYTFRCTGTQEVSCLRLIDAFVAKTIELRKESILGGLDGGITLTTRLIEDAQKRLVSGKLGSQLDSAQQAEIASLVVKRDALELAASRVTGELTLISEGSWVEGKTTATVSATTYGFGIGVGLVAGLLLALQLAAMDKTIRHAWQIRRVNDQLMMIGSPFARHDDGQICAVAASLQNARRNGAESVLIVADHPTLVGFAHRVLEKCPEISVNVVDSTSSPSIEHLLGKSPQVVLVLVKAGCTTRRQLAESIGISTAGGSRLLGVALID